MLVTPSNSTRTVRPATAVTNHMKVRRREKAGRSRRIAFHQIPHSDSGSPRSGMVASMVQVGSGHPIGTIDSQFVNHVWAHDPDATRRAALRYSGTARWTHRRANTKTGRDGPDRVEDLMGKQRQLIWPDAERLDLVQSIQRIQKLYPDFPGHEIEEVLINWIDTGYDPKNYSQALLNELDSLTERWVADHLRNANASKT